MQENKPTVQLSTNAWHYRFMKFILRSIAPTPENMFNLCPYFWLFVCSIIIAIPVVVIRYFFKFLNWTLCGFSWVLEKTIILPTANSWYDKLTDLDVYQIWDHIMQINSVYRLVYGDDTDTINRDDFVEKWWEKKYNKKAKHNGQSTKAFKKWIEIQHIKYREIENQKIINNPPHTFEIKMEVFRDNIGDRLDNLKNWITSWKTLIKWTKTVLGAIITSLGLFCTYFVVNFLGRQVLWIVEHWDWYVVLIVLGIIGCVVVAIGIFVLLRIWVEFIKEKKLKLWYVRIIYYLLYWLVFMPLKIVLYYFFWELILRNLWALIVGGARLLWGSFIGFLGIFGEYFGASYTDYCPGIEWVPSKKTKK